MIRRKIHLPLIPTPGGRPTPLPAGRSIPPRQRLAPSRFHFYRHPNAPPNTPDAEFLATRWPANTWLGETEEGDEFTVGHFWTDLLDLPAGRIDDTWPSAPVNLVYDVEEDEYLHVVMVERQRPRPDFDRAYLARIKPADGAETCSAETFGSVLPILYKVEIAGFASEPPPAFPPEFWEGFNQTHYFFPVIHENHANAIGAFPWTDLIGGGPPTPWYRAPDAMATTTAQPFPYLLGLYRKGNRGTVNLPFGIDTTPGGGPLDQNQTTLYLRYHGNLSGANNVLKYSSPDPLTDQPLALDFESGAGAGLAAYPGRITVQPLFSAPCPSYRFPRAIYFAQYPTAPDTYIHRTALGTLVLNLIQPALFVLYQTGPAQWEGFWSSWLSASCDPPFTTPGRFDFAVHLTFAYPDRWTARVHDSIESYTTGANTALVAIYEGRVPTANLADPAALKVLSLVTTTGRVTDPPARFVVR